MLNVQPRAQRSQLFLFVRVLSLLIVCDRVFDKSIRGFRHKYGNFFQKILDNNFSDLPGLAADVSIPVPEYLVNELIAATLIGNKRITSCHVAIGLQNQVVVELKTNLWPWPVKLKLKLEE